MRIPSLIELLKIILKGIADIGGSDAEKAQDEEDARLLEDGEDDDGISQDSDPKAVLPVQHPPVKSLPAAYSIEQIESRRLHLMKALAAFEALLKQSLSAEEHFSNRFAVQMSFALNLMLYACTKIHTTKNGRTIRLMSFAPASEKEKEQSFAIRAGRLLQRIWVGYKGDKVITDYLCMSQMDSSRDDIFYMIIISRWAITRAFLAVIDAKSPGRLDKHLGNAAVQIYRATLRLGPIDQEKEETIIYKLDRSLGAPETESRSLIEHVRSFAKQASI